jgi:carbonic anhydrase/acetyltransferase-like protein (isoleucine patch superfamily)
MGDYYIAPTAVVQGDVTIGSGSSVWPFCVLRGDVAPIRIGARVAVQDGAILHCNTGVPLEIGDDVGIGHGAVVHCRSVGSRSLVGIRATVLDDVVVGCECIVAAGAVVVPGAEVPDGSVVMGAPARVVRAITDEDRAYIRHVVETYQELAARHAAGEFRALGRGGRV